MTRKELTKPFLDSYGWYGIQVDSHIVSFCETCGAQHSHICVDAAWDPDAETMVYLFECVACRKKEDAC